MLSNLLLVLVAALPQDSAGTSDTFDLRVVTPYAMSGPAATATASDSATPSTSTAATSISTPGLQPT